MASRPHHRNFMLVWLLVALLPLLTEAFMYHPSMYGSNTNYAASQKTTVPKSQKEKLQNPWLWISIAAFSACMYYCLKVSFEGRWRQVCGSDDAYQGAGGQFGGGR